MARKTLGGKWQRRLLQTLHEAGGPLTYRQLRIRCGMPGPSSGKSSNRVRMACRLLVRRELITRVWPGVYAALKEEPDGP